VKDYLGLLQYTDSLLF